MKCDLKTMVKIGVVLAVILAGGLLVFPQFRPVIIGIAPFALLALCPISMLFAVGAMNKSNHNHRGCAACENKNHEHIH